MLCDVHNAENNAFFHPYGTESAKHFENLNREEEKPRWLVLYTRPRYERKIYTQLVDLAIKAYLPLREEVRYWSDRRKVIETPLFLGYIFVNVVEKQRMIALEIPGAVRYVSFGGKLAVVNEETIESIRIMMRRPRDVRLEETTLRLGQKVIVQAGPLMGLSGSLVEFRGSTRVAIMIESINRIVSIEVPISYLRQTQY